MKVRLFCQKEKIAISFPLLFSVFVIFMTCTMLMYASSLSFIFYM